MRAVPFLSLAALTVACSGGRLVDLGDASATDGAGSVTDGSLPDAPPMVDAAPMPPSADAGPSCADLAAQLQAMKAQAVTCCPICNTPQCDVAVKDVCCPFSVTGTAPAGYEALVGEYVAACHPACPLTPCHIAPSKVCVPVDPANPSGVGTCQ